MSTIALIPVKDLDQAKARLAPVLDDAARRELVLAMLHDVLDAALGCAAIDGVAVVTRDPVVLALAKSLGAEGLPEPGGLNEALDAAAQRVAERGATRVVVIAADLPLIDRDALDAEFEVQGDAEVYVTESRDGGTNLLWSPPRAFRYQFGPDSAAKHLQVANRAGLPKVVLATTSPLTLDIDTPEDLQRLRAEADRAAPHTRAALERLGLVPAAH